MEDGSQRVIMSYPGRDAEIVEHYARRGFTVVRVDHGDLVSVKPQGGYRVDAEALKAAIELLGLKLPVKVRHNSRVGSTRGNYRITKDGTHDIMVKSYLTPEQASSTLWHELTHAMQAERAGANWTAWGRAINDQKRWPYSRRPIEIEAQQMSADMADLPLCVAVR